MRYPELGDFCEVAGKILGISPTQVARLPGIGRAESALAAPASGFGDEEFFSTLEEKAAVLLEHLARNHPLPDGNKRTAFALTLAFLEDNGKPYLGADPDRDEEVVNRIAAGGLDRDEIVTYIRERTSAEPKGV
jgi:death-on-curing protein